ncbi:hypothetical protein K4749_09250 [Streptomyces sp. TRM72054]|uniref:hypothetical protein n=1 Tax=Streptomyces sp. TRM72054 TaxID=2870562 RepID=UPI001C8CEE36|nr:hypothetical protein [Streptomyces sp. TRM72054]MBX9393774.1 hypothetical protein [Streptomyces sp. TRM72054]
MAEWPITSALTAALPALTANLALGLAPVRVSLVGRRFDGLVVGDVHGDRYGPRCGDFRGITRSGVGLGCSGFEQGPYELLPEGVGLQLRDSRGH